MLSHRDSDYVGKFTSNFGILEICQQQQAASSSKLPTEIAEYPITRKKSGSGSRYHHSKSIGVKMKYGNVRFILEFFLFHF